MTTGELYSAFDRARNHRETYQHATAYALVIVEFWLGRPSMLRYQSVVDEAWTNAARTWLREAHAIITPL